MLAVRLGSQRSRQALCRSQHGCHICAGTASHLRWGQTGLAGLRAAGHQARARSQVDDIVTRNEIRNPNLIQVPRANPTARLARLVGHLAVPRWVHVGLRISVGSLPA